MYILLIKEVTAMLQIWESLCKEFTPEQLSKVLPMAVPGLGNI